MATSNASFFLTWLAGRLVGQYGEDPDTDVVHRLNAEAARAHTLRANLSANLNTFELVNIGTSEAAAEAESGRDMYKLAYRGRPGALPGVLRLSQQDADDLARQLDAPVDYFND